MLPAPSTPQPTWRTASPNASVPIQVALWDVEHVAAYFCRSPSYVKEEIACLPDFPAPIRLPTGKRNRGHALYEASEVIAWAKQFKEGV